jgi:protein-S-isoprenylcysteine O-methyltransferase Ste14
MNQRRERHATGGRVVEAGLLIALPIACHYLVPLKTLVVRPYTYLGPVLMGLGLALATWAGMHFRRAGTGFDLAGGGSALVTSGPFKFSRNPMYLGMLTWLLGLAVLLGSLMALLFPILMFLLANFRLIPLEESKMAQAMGEAYAKYRSRTRRWL